VARIGMKKNSLRVLVGKIEVKRPPRNLTKTYDDNIKWMIKIELKSVD
jgi:hypothetical protein